MSWELGAGGVVVVVGCGMGLMRWSCDYIYNARQDLSWRRKRIYLYALVNQSINQEMEYQISIASCMAWGLSLKGACWTWYARALLWALIIFHFRNQGDEGSEWYAIIPPLPLRTYMAISYMTKKPHPPSPIPVPDMIFVANSNQSSSRLFFFFFFFRIRLDTLGLPN